MDMERSAGEPQLPTPPAAAAAAADPAPDAPGAQLAAAAPANADAAPAAPRGLGLQGLSPGGPDLRRLFCEIPALGPPPSAARPCTPPPPPLPPTDCVPASSAGEPLGGRGPPLTLREAEQRHATRSLEIQTEQLAQQLAQLQRQLQQVAQQVAQLQRQLELHARVLILMQGLR